MQRRPGAERLGGVAAGGGHGVGVGDVGVAGRGRRRRRFQPGRGDLRQEAGGFGTLLIDVADGVAVDRRRAQHVEDDGQTSHLKIVEKKQTNEINNEEEPAINQQRDSMNRVDDFIIVGRCHGNTVERTTKRAVPPMGRSLSCDWPDDSESERTEAMSKANRNGQKKKNPVKE